MRSDRHISNLSGLRQDTCISGVTAQCVCAVWRQSLSLFVVEDTFIGFAHMRSHTLGFKVSAGANVSLECWAGGEPCPKGNGKKQRKIREEKHKRLVKGGEGKRGGQEKAGRERWTTPV